MKLKQIYHYSLFTILSLSLFSCALYRPSPIQNPLLKEAGDIQLGGSLGSGFSADAAYGPINHLYLTGRYYTASNVKESSNDSIIPQVEVEFPNYHYEFGIGYYDTLGSSLRIQLALGYGAGESGGEIEDFDPLVILVPPLLLFLDNSIYGASFDNYFGQLSLHQSVGDRVRLGFAYRMNYLDYDQFSFFSLNGNTANFDLNSRTQYVDQFAFEINREERDIGGYLQFQLAAARPYSEFFTVRTFGIHFGIYLKLNEMFAKPRKQKPIQFDSDDSYKPFGN